MCHTVPELTLHIPTQAKAFCLVDEALKLRRLLLSPRPLLHTFWLAPFSPFFSSFNWRFREQNVRAPEENACTAGNVQDVRAADIRLASFTLARVACLLQLWIKTSHFFFISSFLKTLYLGTRLVLSPGGEGRGGVLNKCLYGDPRSNPLPFKNSVHRSINVNAGWFFLLFDDVPFYRDFL